MLWLAALIPLTPAAGWPTGAHDSRRTGQSDVVGPADPQAAHDVTLAEALTLDAPPAIDDDGVMLWGTWGVVRSPDGSSDPRTWDKLDGSVRALDRDLVARWSDPAVFDETPYCYDYQGREDLSWCADGGAVSYLNGIVDSTPTLTGDGAAWVSRGDGGLYRVDLADGAATRLLTTWNPEDLDDPDGGGALLSSPLALPDGGVLVGSAGAGPYETHALYALSADGDLRWRLPRDTAGFDGPFWAAPALSPDGGTAYAATWVGPALNDPDEDLALDGLVVAVDLGVADDADDLERIAWQVAPVSGDGDPLHVRLLSVGVDGTIYLGGLASETEIAWVAALDAEGETLWTTALDREDTELVRGLALDESDGRTVTVYAATGHRASAVDGGRLHALDPDTGAVQWTFDPQDEGGHGAPSGLAVDAAGTVFFATQGAGRYGSVYAVTANGGLLWRMCADVYEGAHPILSPEGNVVVGQGTTLTCAMTGPLGSTCRSSATDRTVRVYYADGDAAPDAARVIPALECCRCATGLGPAGGAPGLALLLLVRRRRSR